MSSTNSLLARLLASVAIAATAAGCMTVGPNFTAPPAPAAQGYAMSGDTAPSRARLDPSVASSGPWWTALGSPTLDQVIRQALADSPTVAEADAVLGQARAALTEARGGSLPQIDATGGYNRERANLQSFGISDFGGVKLANPTFNLYSIGGAIGYDLDLFGGQRRRVEGAQARVEAEARRADAAYLTLTSNVALQAVTIATLRAQIASVEQMIEADRQTIELVHKAKALGGSTATAKVAAESQLSQDQTLLPPLQNQLATARHALAQLVGKAPSDWSAPDFALSELTLTAPIPVSLPSQLVRKRPDILAAEADLHAATADIGVATADMYPNIKLSASLTQGALKPENLFSYDATAWNIGAGITAPIFHGGELKARKEAAVQAARASSARYQQTVLTAFVQVSDAMQALSDDDALIAAHTTSVAQADETLRLSKVAFQKGGGTLLDVLDAQRRANEQRSSLVRAQGQRLADVVRLFAASGADWRTAS